MKLIKTKLNELLYYITDDHYKNSLILKLIYIYGRNAREVFNLQTKDINIPEETIQFTTPTGDITYPLVETIQDSLIGYIYDNEFTDEDYLFRDQYDTMEIVIKKLNYYLDKKIEDLNKRYESDLPKLTTKDFKIMRGQHLFLDGADLHTIHELYHNSNIKSTKNHIQYNELLKLKFPCHTLDTLFQDYTDLNLYYEETLEDTSIYTVSNETTNIIIEIDYINDTINLISEEAEESPIITTIQNINPDILCMELKKLGTGEFKFLYGLRFLKN